MSFAQAPPKFAVLDVATAMRSVNGYFCPTCADEELAKRGIDPAHPTQALSGSEAYVSAAQALRNRGESGARGALTSAERGVNRPNASGDQGRKINLYA